MNPLERLSDGYRNWLIDMVWKSSYDDEMKARFEMDVNNAEIYLDVEEIEISMRLNNIDDISAGRNYGIKDWVRDRRRHG